MAEPKKKLSRSRSGARRSHLKLKPISLIYCVKCKEKIRPHRACPFCGYYKEHSRVKID